MSTIVACATPWGRGAVAVVRLSGNQSLAIVRAACVPGGGRWRPRHASLRRLQSADAELLDEALVTWMPGPHSYTGEDVVEIGLHGNPLLVERVLGRLRELGAVLARPGEFTRRSVENGRMDLIRAESVGAVIEATGAEGLRMASAGLLNGLGDELRSMRQVLLDWTTELELRLDNPGEDLGASDDQQVQDGLAALSADAMALAATWDVGRIALAGARVALVGPVNAGKSSLFNQLVGAERALVSEVPGTTRDVVERTVMLRGFQITYLDTAGERERSGLLEARGQALGRQLTQDADLWLVVVPMHGDPQVNRLTIERWSGVPCLVVGTHLDHAAAISLDVLDHCVSNTDGRGIEALTQAVLDRVAGERPAGARAVLLSQRQHDLVSRFGQHAQAAADAMSGLAGVAVAAEEATRGLEVLADLEGRAVREDVLDRLFARFCVGK